MKRRGVEAAAAATATVVPPLLRHQLSLPLLATAATTVPSGKHFQMPAAYAIVNVAPAAGQAGNFPAAPRPTGQLMSALLDRQRTSGSADWCHLVPLSVSPSSLSTPTPAELSQWLQRRLSDLQSRVINGGFANKYICMGA